MKVYSYVTRWPLLTEYNPSVYHDDMIAAAKTTFSVWSTDGSDCLSNFSDAVPATWDQIEARAKLDSLTPHYSNRHHN